MISGKVFEEIKNHPNITVETYGEHELKNVYKPMPIFALANKGIEIPDQAYVQELTGSNKNSVAVLPFANFSINKENEYFSDGITEEIINALVSLDTLQVTSRTSVFAYKNTTKDIRQIGKELNVKTILEGSVRQAGDKIRVTAQLINTDDGFHIWSENFDGHLEDIFQVQDEIAKKITLKLAQNLEVNTHTKLYNSSTSSISAYDNYLQGLYYWNKKNPEAVKKAITFYERAISKSDTYTKAYSGLANCYSFLGSIGHMDGKIAFPRAQHYALKALDGIDFKGEAHLALGVVDLLYHWNIERAESNFRKAITLEPNNEESRCGLSLYYRIMGDFERMILHSGVAVKIAPISPSALQIHAESLSILQKYDEAISLYNKILELDPLYRSAVEGLALVHIGKKNYKVAESYFHKYFKMVGNDFKGGTHLGLLAALQNDREKALQNIEFIKERERKNEGINLSLDYAVIYAILGENDLAFEYLFKAVEDKLGAVLLLKTFRPLSHLKEDPRYDLLLKKIGLIE